MHLSSHVWVHVNDVNVSYFHYLIANVFLYYSLTLLNPSDAGPRVNTGFLLDSHATAVENARTRVYANACGANGARTAGYRLITID